MKLRITYTLALLFATLQTFAQTYEYDANNQLTKVTYADGSTVTYTYDELGNRLSMKKTAGIEIGYISFADNTVKAICIENWDEDLDGELSYDEAASVTDIGMAFSMAEITSFDEFQYFTGVSAIPNEAFSGCNLLTSISFPSSIDRIGDLAFMGCNDLLHLTIPKSVNDIGSEAFSHCSALESIVVEEGNSTYDSRDNCNAIIYKEYNSLILGCKNTIIPQTVEYIERYAFMQVSDLTSITIPSSVKYIGSYAFSGCKSLRSINIPEQVTSIGSCAFFMCSSLESVYSYVQEPFRIYENTFQNWEANASTASFTTATLYVPAGTRDAYLATPAWDKFLNIVEMEATSQGDVNGDGSISIADVTELVNIILGKNLPANQSVADINGDGSVTIADVTALVNIILGKTGQ